MSLDEFTHLSASFDKRGDIEQANAAATLATRVRERAGQPLTDLLVLSHGWNNNQSQARSLYDAMLTSLRTVAEAGPRPLAETLAVLAVHWPSKQFDFERRSSRGGAASLGGRTADQASVIEALEDLREFADSDAERDIIDLAVDMVPKLDDLRSARDAFVATLLPLLNEVDAEDDPGDTPERALASLTGREVLDKLDRPAPPTLRRAGDNRGGAAGSVAAGAQRGAFSFVNLLTFWKMKKRAGQVGSNGVATLLNNIAAALPDVRIHLAGHSFGARLVTAAAMATDDAAPLASLSLLQGAFSHYGFSDNIGHSADKPRPGAFRAVVERSRIAGPIIASHTRNDRAVGLAYPMAARLSRDDAAALGDADSRFGGIGSNGAVRTAEAEFLSLGPVGTTYPFRSGRIFNLRADDFVDGHSDIAGPEVAAALLAAIQHSE